VPNRAADRSAKLVLVERRADRIEVSPCIERRIAKKLEGVTMKGIASRLADGGDYAAVVVPVLWIEVIGQYTEFFDRIQVRNDGGAPFMCSCTSIPLTRKPLDDSRCRLMERLPGFRSPEGSRLPVTPAIMTELGNRVEIGATPG
jgi:hypothetical protein